MNFSTKNEAGHFSALNQGLVSIGFKTSLDHELEDGTNKSIAVRLEQLKMPSGGGVLDSGFLVYRSDLKQQHRAIHCDVGILIDPSLAFSLSKEVCILTVGLLMHAHLNEALWRLHGRTLTLQNLIFRPQKLIQDLACVRSLGEKPPLILTHQRELRFVSIFETPFIPGALIFMFIHFSH